MRPEKKDQMIESLLRQIRTMAEILMGASSGFDPKEHGLRLLGAVKSMEAEARVEESPILFSPESDPPKPVGEPWRFSNPRIKVLADETRSAAATFRKLALSLLRIPGQESKAWILRAQADHLDMVVEGIGEEPLPPETQNG